MRLQSDNVNWWVGVVEDRDDPLQQGRVRVRVVGVHPFSRIQGDFEGIPVEDLPWMSVLLPCTTASVGGVSGAITGMVPGSSVFGIWLDKYKTNGLVLGTYSGNQVNIPNPDEGFSDPTGQYPNYTGADGSALNAGGAYGDNMSANGIQNANSSIGIWAGGADISGPDDNPDFTIEKMLRGDEGVKNRLYWDNLGYPTIGIGHLIIYRKTKDTGLIMRQLSAQLGKPIMGTSISEADIIKLFRSDLGKMQAEIKKNKVIGPVYAKCNRSRQMALENMAFQMGTGGLAKFRNSLALMAAGDYAGAAAQFKQSLWARQTPGRANRVCLVIKNGNLGAYGVIPKKPLGKFSISASAFNSLVSGDSSFDPFDPSDREIYPDYSDIKQGDGIEEDLSVPYVPPESATLFIEPKSSYQAQYPYNKASQSEGGHIQEFDDTPGYERYRLMHPTGSYVEVQPDGTKIDKATGSLFSLTDGDRNQNTAGEFKVNVGGVETYINFADVIRNISGTNTLKVEGDNVINITGNETKKITGDGTIEVSGNVNIIVSGNASIQVSGNADSTVSGDYTLNVGGSFNVTSGGAASIKAPRINLG